MDTDNLIINLSIDAVNLIINLSIDTINLSVEIASGMVASAVVVPNNNNGCKNDEGTSNEVPEMGTQKYSN